MKTLKTKKMLVHLILFAVLPLISVGNVYARSATDMLGLPPYCAGRFARDTNPNEYKNWEARLGPDFIHTHHLCDAIIAINKMSRARNAVERQGLFKSALGNLNYMIQHARPEFSLMSEVYIYRSQAYDMMGKQSEAIADIRKAIELNPKEVNAYLRGAKLLENIGLRQEALNLISEGLRHLPGKSQLEKSYIRLGGKQPFPDPYVTPMTTEQTKTEAGRPREAEEKIAIFDLGRILGGGGNVWAEAGAYYFVELRAHPKWPHDKLLIKLISMVPQPATRVARIGIDLGRHQGLFSDIQVEDVILGKYYPLVRADGSYTHAFWQGFRATYLATFTIDPKIGKMYDPRALPPGGSLTMVATLAPGVRFEDVFEAMKEGLRAPSGLRMGIIAHHTRGYRPDPRQTIMDDGGFVTGSLRKLTGIKSQIESQAATRDEQRHENAASIDNSPSSNNLALPSMSESVTAPAHPSNTGEVQPANPRSSKNPWCRFCPAE